MNIKRSAWLVAAFAMLTVCVYGAFAPEELVVAGLYDTITKYVAEDDVDVIPANVLIDSGGALNKTGGGLLTLPLEKLVQGKEITIGVRDGAMRVTAFDAETVGFNDPEDVLGDASAVHRRRRRDLREAARCRFQPTLKKLRRKHEESHGAAGRRRVDCCGGRLGNHGCGA